MVLRSLLGRAAQDYRTHEAVIGSGCRLTFAEAWDRALRFANGLLEMGIQPRDRVAVIEDNCLHSSDFFLGAAAANVVRVPLYARNSREAHIHMLRNTGCRMVVAAEKFAPEMDGLEGELPHLQRVLVRDQSYEGWLASQTNALPDIDVRSSDYCVIRHTAGTTGKPKGVAYTNQSWLAAGRDWFYNYPPVAVGDPCFHIGPIAHASGYLFTPIWMSGGKNILIDQFDAGDTLELIERERVAYGFIVPTMLNAIVRHPDAQTRDLSSLKTLVVGGAPTNDDTAQRGYALFGDALYQGYGQTEALPITMTGARDWFAEVPGSTPLRAVGRPLPFGEVEIFDPETRAILGRGVEGEIGIRCDGQMEGFWEDPATTAERMVDGWVLTGDIGRIDENGYIYVVDRKDDMIISGGFNIWPAELENAIQDHPAVVEVAVFGIPDERWGETPMAVCVIETGAVVSEADIVELCRERLGSYKKPSRVVFQADPLPRSPVGKLMRRTLRLPFWEGQERKVSGA